MNADAVKLQNAQIWWEVHEKYESELDSIESSDADSDDAPSDSEKSKKPKTKKKKGKKKKTKKKIKKDAATGGDIFDDKEDL